MSLLKPTIGKRVVLTLIDGSVLRGCWYQHDGTYVVSNPLLTVTDLATVYVDLKFVQRISEEVEVPDDLV